MGDEVRINGGHDSLIIRPTAAMADHDIPIAHPASLVDMRSKLELPFAKKALDHVLVCRHASPPLARLSVNSRAIYNDRATIVSFGASTASAARLARSVWPSAAADRVQGRVLRARIELRQRALAGSSIRQTREQLLAIGRVPGLAMPARFGRLLGSGLVGHRIRAGSTTAKGRGVMREVRSTRPGAAAVMAIAVFLAACSHDPIQPAPVLMMGGNRTTDATAPAIAPPRPASAPEMRVAAVPPSVAAKHLTPGKHAASRDAIVAKHPAHTRLPTR